MAPSCCSTIPGLTQATENNEGVLWGQLRKSCFNQVATRLKLQGFFFTQRGRDSVAVWKKEKKKKRGEKLSNFLPSEPSPWHQSSPKVTPELLGREFAGFHSTFMGRRSKHVHGSSYRCVRVRLQTSSAQRQRATTFSSFASEEFQLFKCFWMLILAAAVSPGRCACKTISRSHSATCDVN